MRRELRRLLWRLADKPFIVVRGEALYLMCEEDRVGQMRPVEKATPTLSVPVGGSVADVLGLDAVVLGDGGVSAGAVCVTMTGCQEVVTRRCVVLTRCCRVLSVGVCVTLTVSGGGDLAVRVVVSGVDESVCGVNSVMTAGILDLCGVDTVMSGVDRFVCCVSTAMTAGESDVCGGDRVVSGETGESSEVDVFVSGDDVVVCGDDPLLVCRWLVTPCCVGLE